MDYLSSINWLATIVATVGAIAVGFLWYGPLFGKEWMALTGRTAETMAEEKKSMGATYAKMSIAMFIMVIVLGCLLGRMGVSGMASSIKSAGMLWFGLIALPMYINTLFGKNKSLKLLVIDSGHYLAALVIAAAILSYWQ